MFLRIPYKDDASRALAKEHGAKWDPDRKLWRIDDSSIPEELKQFCEQAVQAGKEMPSEILEKRLTRLTHVLSALRKDIENGVRYSKTTCGLLGPFDESADMPTMEALASLARGLAATLLASVGYNPEAVEKAVAPLKRTQPTKTAPKSAPREDTKPYTPYDNDVPF